MLELLIQFTIIPMLTTEVENVANHSSVESRGSHFYHNPFPPPINQHYSDQQCIGERGINFSHISDKVCQHFFHDCRWNILENRSEITNY